MNKKAIQRQDVIHEFIHTEQHYVRKLKVLNIVSESYQNIETY